MKTIKVNSEVSSDFGSYVGRLTLILKVIIVTFFNNLHQSSNILKLYLKIIENL